jgi:hypothetical protein
MFFDRALVSIFSSGVGDAGRHTLGGAPKEKITTYMLSAQHWSCQFRLRRWAKF